MDGGLDIPHSEKRFAGFSKDDKQLNAEVHRKYIYGGHIAAYMRVWFVIFFLISCSYSCISCQCHFDSSSFVLLVFFLQTLAEDEPEKYQSHFSEYIKRGIDADNLEELYKKVHAAIRADPTAKKSQKQPPKEHKRCVHTLFDLVVQCLMMSINFMFLGTWYTVWTMFYVFSMSMLPLDLLLVLSVDSDFAISIQIHETSLIIVVLRVVSFCQ